MKKKVLFMLLLLFTFFDICYAYGECELNSRVRLREEANNIKISYEPVLMYCRNDNMGDLDSSNDIEYCGITPNEEEKNYDYKKNMLNINIYNMSADFYIVMHDSRLGDQYIYDSDKENDGVVRILSDNDDFVNLLFNVYGNSDCQGFLVRKIKMTLPKYNYYSQFDICDDIKDYYLCQEYINFDMDGQYFFNHVEEYKKNLSNITDNSISLEEENNSEFVNFINNIAKHKYIVVIVIVLIGIGMTFIILKKKVKK